MPKSKPGGTSYDEEYKAMQARVEAQDAEIAALKAQKAAGTTLRFAVSAKRGISLYGLGKFPVTLYASQWQRAKPFVAENLDSFIEEHREELSWKEDGAAT